MIFKIILFIIAISTVLSVSGNAHQIIDQKNQVRIFACEPEWEALAKILGGHYVQVFSATKGLQDPHQVQARPSLIRQIRHADIFICSGAELEAAWLPLLLRRASNSALEPNKMGYFFAADYVRLLGIPKILDRSQGDVHAAGNPHIHTDPKNMAIIAKVLVKRLKKIDPQHAQIYQKKGLHFLKEWKKAIKRWKKQAKPLKGKKILVQHAGWDYLIHFTQLKVMAIIEEKAGIPPSSRHLSTLVKRFSKRKDIQMIIHAAYQNKKASHWLSKRTGIQVVELPFTIGGNAKADNLFHLYDETFRLLIKGIRQNESKDTF
jgi:zinc/manganese transport system substrate-binding protein